MRETISIDPVTRIEGHLAIRIETESGIVKSAYSSGEMFRGFESILEGRNPLDAQQITQRICGVCPISHGMASVLAQEDAYALSCPPNGVLARNLVQAANFLASHLVHFYQLSALDFIDISAIASYSGKDPKLNELKAWVQSQMSSDTLYPAAPFLPRYSGDYIENADFNVAGIKHYLDAFEIRRIAHRMGAVFGGKLPHSPTLVPGGITCEITADKIGMYKAMLQRVRSFIDEVYFHDALSVAEAFPGYMAQGKGCGNFLVYGAFVEADSGKSPVFPSGAVVDGILGPIDPSKIGEEVGHSFFENRSSYGLHPSEGRTSPSPRKPGAYSWIKAPRYGRAAMETGPLARIAVGLLKRDPVIHATAKIVFEALSIGPENLDSVMGRHLARAIECKIVVERCFEWLDRLRPGKKAFADFSIPESASGVGLTEAPRGALGHWLKIEEGNIRNYQCIVPTTWNCSPRDDRGIPGPVEKALEGLAVADAENPIEAVRVVRSFDPCAACAVH